MENDDDFDLNDSLEFETGICSICGKQDIITEVHAEWKENPEKMCYACCGEEGFCFGCGNFSTGTSAYDFSKIGHYCENCQGQIRDTCDPHGEELEDWEYPDYDGQAIVDIE